MTLKISKVNNHYENRIKKMNEKLGNTESSSTEDVSNISKD